MTAAQANGEVRNFPFLRLNLKIPRPLAPRPENGAGRQAHPHKFTVEGTGCQFKPI
ncbi:hypothetical protein HMPREF1548_04019 [Clostridium sp. KLE 1755]|nr:hypothetical protein HMPREF1548_04019 [Clostridium sp. KLE 1755]